MKFGDWLRLFMEEHNIRQVDIIRESGLHQNVVCWWMNNRNIPNSYNLAILAHTLSNLSDVELSKILMEMVCTILKS